MSGPGGRGSGEVVWRARIIVACLVLVALCFHQAPGKIVPDTKLDLTADPGAFLGRALHLWDPQGAFGQLQNQAYGYLLPMGPFHWLLDVLSVPDWIIQRLWWSLVLCVALVGVWKLCNALQYGVPWTRFAAALFYALSPRMLGELSITSIEVWPIAMAPWVLLPLVTPRPRSFWWRAGWSAVAFALVGGVNAVATGATLVLPALWLLTRRFDRSTVKLAVSWFVGVVAVSLWWLVPLLLLGRYSPPFLDWIENAAITTHMASVFESFRGTSQWLNFLAGNGGPSWPAGWLYVTQPMLILTTSLVALLGLVGLAMGSLKHRGFLQLSLVVGLLLVTLGHAGAAGSPLAPQLQDLLDGPLAAFRNTHKFELVVRLPLTLAAAHALARLASWSVSHRIHRRVVPVLVSCLVVSVATPAIVGQLPRPEGYDAIPGYWREAATWLDAQPGDGSVLVVPAASFADFTWGSTKDEPFQALLKRPMAVRDAVPLGSAGATRWLDEVERRLGSGVGDRTLQQALQRAGVRYVVVRNDLRYDVQLASTIAVHESLGESGIGRVASFGPPTGSRIEQPDVTLDGHTRLPYASVEIYDAGQTDAGRLVPRSRLVEVRGAAEDVPAALTAMGADQEAITSSDAAGRLDGLPLIETDGLQRREVSFGRPAENYSPVLTASDPGRLGRRVLGYQLDGASPLTTRTWAGGVVDVRASSSAADADATLRTGPGNGPFAAVDGDPATRWVSGRFGRASGEWLEVTFAEPRTVDGLTVQFSLDPPTTEPVRTLQVETDTGSLTSVVSGSGDPQSIPVPPGSTQRLRLSIGTTDGRQAGGVSIAEVTLPGMLAVNRLSVPASTRQPSALVFRNQQIGRSSCLHVDTRPLCRPSQAEDSEEPTGLLRSIELPKTASYQVQGTALPQDGEALERLLAVPGGISATASSRAVAAPEGRPGAAVDRDLGTGWVADPDDPAPSLTLRLPRDRSLTGLQFLGDPYLTASRPAEVSLRFDGGAPTRSAVDAEGYVRFAARKARLVQVDFVATRPQLDFDSATGYSQTAPVGVAEVRVLGAEDLRRALDPNRQIGVPCGFGPGVRVDGVPAGTQATATVRDLLQRRPVTFSGCGKDTKISVLSGRHSVDVLAGGGLVPIELRLSADDAWSATSAQGVKVSRQSPAELKLDVPPAAEQSVLTVAQNYNEGWQAYDAGGHRLTPIRVGGWQQGWLVPAGQAQVVTARFGPDGSYRTGLLLGLLALLSVVALALFSRRSDHLVQQLVGGRILRPWAVLGFGLVAGTFMAGWIGLAAVSVAALCAWALPRRAVLGLVAAVVSVGTVVAATQPWPGGDAGVTSAAVQASVLFGCALASLSAFAGETSYRLSRLPRRMIGRSTP
ncbi:alpha-(1-_3)-arabinofuranosyltransferase family protein [Kribbella sp. NPDC058693]|uniref:alpha-(1->3)-arabinofuranosyltransferase domain-containing protein n=1 Tax=Kribbella sp. NPDC058693 TaxID=3346602 RepID=UPI003651F247